MKPCTARAFGTPEDLAIDFACSDRPALVTRVLSGCLPAGDDMDWWQRTVSERTAALLGVVAASEAQPALSLQARCRQPRCAELLSFDLPLQDLVSLAAPAGSIDLTLPGGEVRLRRPTGADLLQWRRLADTGRHGLMRAMLQTLLLAGELRDEDEPALRDALGKADPLVAFAVECQCPACGAAVEVDVDLESIALQRLRGRQEALLREIHLLASHYGWSEEAIAALPAARRARYVALIEH